MVIAIDDNTSDESTWRPVEAWCARYGVKFAHLEDWPGYKSGALNYALKTLTDPRAEVIGLLLLVGSLAATWMREGR